MDRAISASDANRRFSEMLRELAQGEGGVMSRGRPVARVTLIDDAGDHEQAIRDLVDYLASRPRRRLDGWLRNELYPWLGSGSTPTSR